MEARQINLFDVLRGMIQEGKQAYIAKIEAMSSNADIPPPIAEELVLPTDVATSEAGQADSGTAIISLGKQESWLSKNLLLVVLAIGVVIIISLLLYYHAKDKKEAEEEFRRKEAETLPKINYPWPDAATQGPVRETEPEPSIEPEQEPVSYSPSLVEDFFKEPVPTMGE